jgi:altronate dehydratase
LLYNFTTRQSPGNKKGGLANIVEELAFAHARTWRS